MPTYRTPPPPAGMFGKLRCGVCSLTDLRQLMTVEETTLPALAKVREVAGSGLARHNLGAAETARAARLHELRTAAAMVVTVGAYYKARALSTAATIAASTLGFVGIIAVIAAVGWPGGG